MDYKTDQVLRKEIYICKPINSHILKNHLQPIYICMFICLSVLMYAWILDIIRARASNLYDKIHKFSSILKLALQFGHITPIDSKLIASVNLMLSDNKH